MTYKPFYAEELEFEAWVAAHPFGFVINSRPGHLDGGYLVAHQPKSPTFDRHAGAKTTYSKHCFDSSIEALTHLEALGFARPSFKCTSCNVMALEPTVDSAVLTERVGVLLHDGVPPEPAGNRHPRRVELLGSFGFERDAQIAARVMQLAANTCELCGSAAPFRTAKGIGYLEVHHVRRLADLGSDTMDNAVAICPNCHRAIHYAENSTLLSERLYQSVPRLRRT